MVVPDGIHRGLTEEFLYRRIFAVIAVFSMKVGQRPGLEVRAGHDVRAGASPVGVYGVSEEEEEVGTSQGQGAKDRIAAVDPAALPPTAEVSAPGEDDRPCFSVGRCRDETALDDLAAGAETIAVMRGWLEPADDRRRSVIALSAGP
jgi:hypothetical protein